jgi:long-chain acyl-CoA synthetase
MKNFYEKFEATVARFGERPAIEVQRRETLDTFTYNDLHRLIEVAAALLAGRGVSCGDRCAILAENDAYWCGAYLGMLRLGAVAVPLDTAYRAKQIATLVRDADPKVLFTTPRFLPVAQEGIALADSACEVLLLHGEAESLPCLAEAARASEPPSVPPCPATAEDSALMLYTSGTTSDPKGVVLTHGNLLAEADAVFGAVYVDENDRVLGVLPLFHALAQVANLLLPFAQGARVVFLESINTIELLRALRERDITAFACVPQFFYLIHQRVMQEVAKASWAKRAAFHTLLALNGALRRFLGVNLGRVFFSRVHDILGRGMRLLVTGGSRFDPVVGRDLQKLGFEILQAYGLTECAAAASLTRPGDLVIEASGQPLPGVEVKILPPETGAGSESRDGEICIRGAIVMQGYYKRPDVNAATLRDGWLHSGDLGYLDASGRVYVTGRKKEIIVLSSGKNIYPEEIETHYLQSPYIKELCVLGVARPGEPVAERLHAVVVPNFEVMRERKVLNTREVLRFEIEGLSVQLPNHKRVLGFDIWTEDLPRTTTRKLKRFEIERRLREQAQAAIAEVVPQATRTAEEIAWASDAHVSRALAVIAESAKYAGAGCAGGTATEVFIRPEANIELDLGLDSMERVELLTHLQQMFGTRLPEEVASRIYTVRELVEAVRPAEGGAAAAEGRGDTWGRLLDVSLEDDPDLAALLKSKPLFAPLAFLAVKCASLAARLLLRFRVTGREHIPRQGPFLLCPNHQSFLDAFLLVSVLPRGVVRDLFFVGASEYFATPLMRWLARKINVVPVDPDTNLVRAMQAGAFGLRHGKVLILFPEGERSIDGEIKKFKKGAAILSAHLGAPIVPVALEGAFEVWPRGFSPRWRMLLPGGARVRMHFGAPLPSPAAPPATATLTQAEAHYSSAAERLRAAVVEMWRALRGPTPV